EAGIAQMRQGLVAFRATGAELLCPYLLALLADVCGASGQIEAGLSALEEALVAVEQHTERFYAAELYRLKGELVLRQYADVGAKPAPRAISPGRAAGGGASGWSSLQMEAETYFQSALDIAQRQEAKSLELRAAISLARLWGQQGKRAAARQLVGEVYGWFTEGFATADLREALGLLQELA